MDSTRITLTPELKARFAQGYNELGYAVSSWDYAALSGCGALHSTVNDLLKFVSANLGLTPCGLTPLMEKTHVVHFHDSTVFDSGLVWVIRQAQGARIVCHNGGTGGYCSFIGFDKTRRHGVVVLSNFLDEVGYFGLLLLESEWQSDRRPKEATITCFIIGELLPESETRFFERLSGMPMTFSRDARGKITCLTAHDLGQVFSYRQTSEQPPKAPEPPKPRVAIKLDPKLLDACVGQYEFAPHAVFPPTGMKVRIWREGEQLVWQAWGKDAAEGAIDIYPESETNFFLPYNGAQLTFIKNDRGEVLGVIHHMTGLPDCEGQKRSALVN